MTFLVGLNESCAHIHIQILLFDTLPPISQFFSLVSQEKSQREIGNISISENLVFVVKITQNSSFQNFNKSFIKNDTKDKPKCVHYDGIGHTKDKCFKIYGYPPNFPFKNKKQQNVNQVLDTPSTSNSNLVSNLSPL
uniref:Retrovirus-related Pol polyprotein from transposon TNT 1-94 n=1 Tax=Cajanus cajan TaxID=3821 RepID=A0A151SMT7_CAJCA|nr:hypothetical protein KK1_002287 [Cajanus cajan]